MSVSKAAVLTDLRVPLLSDCAEQWRRLVLTTLLCLVMTDGLALTTYHSTSVYL